MTIDKTQCCSTSGLTGLLGIAGKTITSITAFRHGSVEVIDILCTDTAHYYIKERAGRVEAGGNPEWGSGTQIGGR